MESHFGHDIPSFKQFLAKFYEDNHGSVTEDDTFPFRLVPYYVSKTDAEGECIDWTLQYLAQNKCPPLLALNIARAVSNEFKSTDLIELYQADVNEQSEDYVPQLEAHRFSHAVFHKVHNICTRWHHDLPKFSVPETFYEVSSHAIRNSRRKMEDRHVVIQDLNTLFELKDYPSQSYFAVFDGHSGLDAAWYAAAHAHINLIHQPMFRDDVNTALKKAYIKTDEDFNRKAKNESLRSGSTGVSILLRDRKLHLAWLGDSQAFLVKDGVPVSIMSPHKPEREDEKRRVEALGGCVVWFGAWRVNGTLSVSRAIGDADHKPYISGDPDVYSYQLDGTEDYVVIGCDGLWDNVAPNDLVHIVHHHIQENDGNRTTVANRLINFARDGGSSDNISVIVVFLRENIAVPPNLESSDEEKQDGGTEKEHSNEKENKNTDGNGSNSEPSHGASSGGSSCDSGAPNGDTNKLNGDINKLSSNEPKQKLSPNKKVSLTQTSPGRTRNLEKVTLKIDLSPNVESLKPGVKPRTKSGSKSPKLSPLSPREKFTPTSSPKLKTSTSTREKQALSDRTADVNNEKRLSPVATKQKRSSCDFLITGANMSTSGSHVKKSPKQQRSSTLPASIQPQNTTSNSR